MLTAGALKTSAHLPYPRVTWTSSCRLHSSHDAVAPASSYPLSLMEGFLFLEQEVEVRVLKGVSA